MSRSSIIEELVIKRKYNESVDPQKIDRMIFTNEVDPNFTKRIDILKINEDDFIIVDAYVHVNYKIRSSKDPKINTEKIVSELCDDLKQLINMGVRKVC